MGSTINSQLYLSFNDSSQKDDIIYNILTKKRTKTQPVDSAILKKVKKS